MTSNAMQQFYELWIVDLKFSSSSPRLERTGNYALYFAFNQNPDYGKLLTYSHHEEAFSIRPVRSRKIPFPFQAIHDFNIAIPLHDVRNVMEDSDGKGYRAFRKHVLKYEDQDRFLKPLLEAFKRCINPNSSEYVVNDKANPGSYYVIKAWLNELVKADVLSLEQVRVANFYLDEDWRNVGRQLFIRNGGRA